MLNFVKTSLVLSTLLLLSCGGDESSDDAGAQGSIVSTSIADQGFAENGIFAGSLPEGELLLILERGSYFLVAGDIASQGSYQIDSVQLSGSGPAYSLSANGELTGFLQLRGEYRTDRHLELIWTESSTGSERSLNVEATPLYFEEASLDNVLGAWINQDEANLVFFDISENKDPIGGDDFVAVTPGTSQLIDVLANDRDPEDDMLRIASVDATSTLGGTIVVDDQGTPDVLTDDLVLYTPPVSFQAGFDSFRYFVEDPDEGSDNPVVLITAPVSDVDLSLMLTVDNEVPLAGDFVQVSTVINNPGTDSIRAQVLLTLGDGLVYRSDDGAGDYDAAKGFWAVDLNAGESKTLMLEAFIDSFGEFDIASSITTLDARDTDDTNNTSAVTLVPGNLDVERAPEFRTAEIEGVILSSLTQISGSITENPFGANVYSIELDFGGGGLGGGSGATDSFNGYVIASEEDVETQSDVEGEPPTLQLRPTILILAASPSAIYLNKLFGVSEDELSGN
jgi:hypothetical protein